MHHITAATQTMDIIKRPSGDTFWTSEWTFSEDGDVALQKVARSFAGKQTAAKHVVPAQAYCNQYPGI